VFKKKHLELGNWRRGFGLLNPTRKLAVSLTGRFLVATPLRGTQRLLKASYGPSDPKSFSKSIDTRMRDAHSSSTVEAGGRTDTAYSTPTIHRNTLAGNDSITSTALSPVVGEYTAIMNYSGQSSPSKLRWSKQHFRKNIKDILEPLHTRVETTMRRVSQRRLAVCEVY